MEIITDVDDPRIKEVFEKYGNHSEHNYHHYKNFGSVAGDYIFPLFENKYGIMGYINKKTAWCYTNPLAPQEKQREIFLKFLEWAFENEMEKLRSEITEDLWKAVTENLAPEFRAIKPSFVYMWPVYDVKNWDSELSGEKMKKIRNLKNRFFREHTMEVMGQEQFSDQELEKLVLRWKEARNGHDRTHTDHYFSAIKNGFAGYDSVRIIVIDGEPHVINGGWKIPNSNNFYSQLGINDYMIEGSGEISYIEDLDFLKNAGFEYADFGGSTESMMIFKKKFIPFHVYNTIEFSIVKEP